MKSTILNKIPFLFLGIFLFSCASSKPDISTGLRYLDRGKYEQAYYFFKELEGEYPKYRVYTNTAREKAYRQYINVAEKGLMSNNLDNFYNNLKKANRIKPNKQIQQMLSVVNSLKAKGFAEAYILKSIKQSTVKKPSARKQVVAVWPLTIQGLDKKYRDTLAETVRAELLQTGKFRVIDEFDMKKIVKDQELHYETDCDTTDMAVELGQSLQAEKIVTGSVVKTGDMFQVVLKLTNVQSKEIEKVGEITKDGDEEILVLLIKKAVKKLTGK